MTRYIPAFLVMPLLLLACSDSASQTVTRLSTDAPAYTLTRTSSGYEGRVTLSFTNGNRVAVTIGSCSVPEWRGWLERRRPTDGVWEAAAAFGDNLKCGGGVDVPAGATVRRVVKLGFGESPIAGEYRVVVEVHEGLSPSQQVTSNAFTLVTSAP
jgi:hypothetical protein